MRRFILLKLVSFVTAVSFANQSLADVLVSFGTDTKLACSVSTNGKNLLFSNGKSVSFSTEIAKIKTTISKQKIVIGKLKSQVASLKKAKPTKQNLALLAKAKSQLTAKNSLLKKNNSLLGAIIACQKNRIVPPSPTANPTATVTASATESPTATAISTATASPTVSITVTATATATSSPTATSTPITCPVAQFNCSGVCKSVLTDKFNCGACGTVCLDAQSCVNGFCVSPTPPETATPTPTPTPTPVICPVGQSNCGGVCKNTLTDPTNCGACGSTCIGGQTCTNGQCTAPCPVGQNLCSGSCKNLQTDTSNCGSCGTTCSPTANSAAACALGLCTVGTCNAGFQNCDLNALNGCETNTSSSISNCGSCGNVCPTRAHAATTCSSGVCGIGACDSGYLNCDSQTSNGCENNVNSNPVCASSTYIGVVNGDTDGNNFYLSTGTGEAYFMVQIAEGDSGILSHDLTARVSLAMNGADDYDLEVQCLDCGRPVNSSTLGAGATDFLDFRRADVLGSDQGFTLLIGIKFFNVNSCNPWILSIQGNTNLSGITCN